MDGQQMIGALLDGGKSAEQRRAIAKAITLLESTRADHRAQADVLLTALLPHTGKSFRLGISGVPGVGKSTFIEALGLYLIDQGHRVAVLTIDHFKHMHDGEKRVTVLLDFRPLVTMMCILDSKWVQIEFHLHFREFRRLGIT